MLKMVEYEMNQHAKTLIACMEELQNHIHMACVLTTDTLAKGNKILIFGNGGSAADAQHIAAELTGRYKKDRRGLPAVALSVDTSALTAIGNDFGFDHVFSRQVEALANEGDLLIGISTSGNSQNVIKALKIAKNLKCRSISFSGKGGGQMSEISDVNIVIPSNDTPRIQEMHILIGHIICQSVDNVF